MFWEKFYLLCSSTGKSPNSVAKELDISSGSITAYKNGRNPRAAVVKKVADYFGVSTDYLLGETDVKEKPTPSGELSEDDKKLLTFFNQLPPQVQSIFANMQKLSPAQLDALEAVVRSYLPKE